MNGNRLIQYRGFSNRTTAELMFKRQKKIYHLSHSETRRKHLQGI